MLLHEYYVSFTHHLWLKYDRFSDGRIVAAKTVRPLITDVILFSKINSDLILKWILRYFSDPYVFTVMPMLSSEITDGQWNTIHEVLLAIPFIRIYFELFTFSRRDTHTHAHTVKLKLQSMHVWCVSYRRYISFFSFLLIPCHAMQTKIKEGKQMYVLYGVFARCNREWIRTRNVE